MDGCFDDPAVLDIELASACIYVIVRATMIFPVLIDYARIVLHSSANMSPYLKPCRDHMCTAMISEFGQSRRLKPNVSAGAGD